MKLLYVAPSAYLLGGVQDWLADLVAAQRRQGLAVTVAVPDDAIHRLAPYAQRYPQLDPVPFRNPTGSETGRIQALERLLRDHPDHLVVGVNMAALFPAVRRLRRRGSFRGRLVVSLHAIEADYYADLLAQRDIIDAVVATNRLSEALARDWSSLAPDRLFYAPYGVPIATAPLAKVRAAPLRIAWVGRLEQPQKRVNDLPAILRALEARGVSFQLTIAGEGPARPSLEQALAPWIARDLVTLTGSIPRQELGKRVYGSHQVLLITSHWETGPIVAWEAMAAGMAVVSSRYVGSGLEGALVHGRTALLFPTGDAEAAAGQLARLQQVDLLQELAQAGFDLVQQRYSRGASAAAWMAALQAAADLDPLAPPAPAATVAPAGSLDRRLGVERAEWARRLLGRRFRHREAGSEWPHSGHGGVDPSALMERAEGLDFAGGGHG